MQLINLDMVNLIFFIILTMVSVGLTWISHVINHIFKKTLFHRP
jgi:hypothetical protein